MLGCCCITESSIGSSFTLDLVILAMSVRYEDEKEGVGCAKARWKVTNSERGYDVAIRDDVCPESSLPRTSK